MHLGLGPGVEGGELGPVAHQLAQLPRLGRSDPRLGQVVAAQALGDLGGVLDVVLHPPSRPVQARGMDQMDIGPFGLEQVDGPVPAITGLDGHLRIRSGLGQRHGQGHGVVVNLHVAEHFALGVHAHDHRSPAMQVDAHVLSLHNRSSSSRGALGFATSSASALGRARVGEDPLPARCHSHAGHRHSQCDHRRRREGCTAPALSWHHVPVR